MEPIQLDKWKRAVLHEEIDLSNFKNFNSESLLGIFEVCISDGIETCESVSDIINFIAEERNKIIELDKILKNSKLQCIIPESEYPFMQKALESKQYYFNKPDLFEFFYTEKAQNLLASEQLKLPLYRKFLISCFDASKWREEYGIDLYSRPYFTETILPWIECIDANMIYIARDTAHILREQLLYKSNTLIPNLQNAIDTTVKSNMKDSFSNNVQTNPSEAINHQTTYIDCSTTNIIINPSQSKGQIAEEINHQTTSNESSKTDNVINPSQLEVQLAEELNTNFLEVGFFDLPKVKLLSPDIIQKLLFRLSSHRRNVESWNTSVQFKLALLDHLESIDLFNSKYDPSGLMKKYKKIGKILGYKSDDSIRKHWPKTKTDKIQLANTYQKEINQCFGHNWGIK